MDDIILQINDTYEETDQDTNETYNGILIKTSKQDIKCLLSYSNDGCCEINDVLLQLPEGITHEELVGATVSSVMWGTHDDADWSEIHVRDEHDLQSAVIIIETSCGLVKLVAYNEHNGYYPHDVLTVWNGHRDIQQL